MTHSVKWLTSNEAAAARYKRITDGKKYPMITHQYVVHAAIRKVKRGGSLGSPDIYDLSDFMEEK